MSSLHGLSVARRVLRPAILGGLLAMVAIAVTPPATAQCPETSVPVVGLPAAGDEYGTSVDLAGEVAVIGAPGWAPVGGNDVGRVTVSLRNGPTWFSSELPRPAYVSDDDRFGQSVAINETGDVIIVGAPGFDGVAIDGGLAVIYEYDAFSGSWNIVADFPGIFASGFFGWSVAASGDLVAVGEPGGAFALGTVNVYRRSAPGVWVSDYFVTGYEPFAAFGWDVDLHGDLLAVGCPLDDDDNDADIDVGAALVFRRDAAGWSMRERLHTGGDANELYGWSVGLFADTLVVGSPGVALLSPGGLVGIYEWDGSLYQWAYFLWNTQGSPYRIGSAVAIEETRAAAASPGWNTGGLGIDTGQVFVFGNDPLSSWYQPVDLAGNTPAAGAQFGFAVALSGQQLLVGQPFAAPGGLGNAGLVTAYDLSQNIPHADLGGGLAGTGGQTPILEPNAGFCDYLWEEVVMFGGRPSTLTYIVLGIGELGLPFKGGVLWPTPDILIPVTSFNDGTLWAGFSMPTGLPGFSLWWQFWVKDPGGIFGWAATNGLRADIPPF